MHTPGVTESGDRILEPLDLQRAAGGRERGLRVLPGFMIQSPTLRDAMTLRHARLACCLKADGVLNSRETPPVTTEMLQEIRLSVC